VSFVFLAHFVLLLSFMLATSLETRAHAEASTIVTDALLQLKDDNGDLDPLHCIEKVAGETTVTVADAIAILQIGPNNAVSW
jgi:hypothetical protein